ncbi:RagB/SusD family nutrient uptake outer membrane protein [Carboxylicivirga sp. A043]|uniref:RagB/SusD family nutrient uptake outer membrane protein n=1 Tax=Carboxylicivirga litoralis TaxID=2816963 RepID=UPI0021CB84B4|nr:RagB/SusD family nutrient uptake outer membrane protein [Carboxylicivirga sp. A043]MCU4155437.1 RagB/SusD family nutrient uptake outer membrane protein [Carboxylicivirga sp. A043]
MNKKIYTWLLIPAIIMGLFSCELDRTPFESIEKDDVYSSGNALEALTLGNYAILKGKGIADGYSWVNNFYRFAEYPGDNVALSGSTTDPLMFIYNYKRQTTGYRKQAVWTSSYKTIVGCNTVIERAEEGVSEEIDHMIGSNYFLRGMVYFYLTNVFGRPYNQDPVSNLGVPLKLTTDVNDQPIRSSVKDCYAQVVSDLKKAEELMSIEKTASYATKESAQALLSRVYLYMEENDLAIEYADKVINSGRYHLLSKENFKKYPKFTPDENGETIFALRYVDGADNTGQWDDWYTFPGMYAAVDAQGNASLTGAGWGELYASVTYRDIVEEWPDDARAAFVTAMVQDESSEELYGVWYGLNAYADGASEDIKKYNSFLFHQDQVSADMTTLTQTWTIDTNGDGTDETITEISPITAEVDPKTGVTNYSVTPYMVNTSTGATTQLDAPVKLRINKMLATRQTYPKYFITKCSGQENKGHLWSPVVVRYAEMYLNKAEAFAKKGDLGSALTNVNEIRRRAIGAEAEYTASDVTADMSILDLVLKERRLELAYEGHRKFDVFRNGLTMDRQYPGTHLRGNDPYYTIAPTSYDIVEYLPEKEIQAQPDLIQNP